MHARPKTHTHSQVELLGQAVEYGADRAKATCEAAKVNCVYVETRDMKIPTGWDQVRVLRSSAHVQSIFL